MQHARWVFSPVPEVGEPICTSASSQGVALSTPVVPSFLMAVPGPGLGYNLIKQRTPKPNQVTESDRRFGTSVWVGKGVERRLWDFLWV